MSCWFFVPGIPAPQGSKRHVGRGVLVESSKQLKPWRLDVTATARQAWADRAPLEHAAIDMEFVFPRPKSHYRTGKRASELRDDAPRHHTVKPDIDKLARAVLDALTWAAVLRDDSRVHTLTVGKRYGQDTGVTVTIEDIA
jgi:crossover junction endodeoxyribonuclease RusA